jgi:type IX secretion system PorP/SprF family membrane protein
VQGGGFQKSVNYTLLTFNSQYVQTGGGMFDTNLDNGETFASSSVLIGDVNAGLLYYYGKDGARINPFIGGAVSHINQPKETFFGADNRLPMKILGHAGLKINLTERVQILAKGLYMTQKEAQEMTFSGMGNFYFKDQDTYIIAGGTVRVANSVVSDIDIKNLDAMIMELGIKWKKIIYRISYDVNISTLKPNTNGRGGLEMSLTYIPIKYNPNPVKTCPRL